MTPRIIKLIAEIDEFKGYWGGMESPTLHNQRGKQYLMARYDTRYDHATPFWGYPIWWIQRMGSFLPKDGTKFVKNESRLNKIILSIILNIWRIFTTSDSILQFAASNWTKKNFLSESPSIPKFSAESLLFVVVALP